MEYDFLKIVEDTVTLKAEGNKIVSSKKSSIQRNGFRRFENDLMIQTSSLGETNLERLLIESKKYGGLGAAHNFGFSKEVKDHRKSNSVNSDALESYKVALSNLVDKYPDFVFSGQCVVSNKNVFLNSSYGLDLSTAGGIIDWYIIYQRKGSGNMLDGYMFGQGNQNTIFESVKNQEVFLEGQNFKIDLQSGHYPVLLVEEKSVLKKLLESFMVNKYEEGSALYSGKLGAQLFNQKVEFYDSGYHPETGNYMFFDGEGTIRDHDLLLIKDGVFSSLVSDLRYANKYATHTTGNGLRGYNRGVSLDFKGLHFRKRDSSWKEILKSFPTCIVGLLAAGGESNDLGEFSTPVQIGYIFKNGELEGLAPQITVKTSIDQFLGSKLIDISSDGFMSDKGEACVISEMEVMVN